MLIVVQTATKPTQLAFIDAQTDRQLYSINSSFMGNERACKGQFNGSNLSRRLRDTYSQQRRVVVTVSGIDLQLLGARSVEGTSTAMQNKETWIGT